MAEERSADGIRLVRPLLNIPRDALAEIAAASGLATVDDPSNRDPRFDRVRLRQLMPVLSEHGFSASRLSGTARQLGVRQTLWTTTPGRVSRRIPRGSIRNGKRPRRRARGRSGGDRPSRSRAPLPCRRRRRLHPGSGSLGNTLCICERCGRGWQYEMHAARSRD
jgi:hypothetical protein